MQLKRNQSSISYPPPVLNYITSSQSRIPSRNPFTPQTCSFSVSVDKNRINHIYWSYTLIPTYLLQLLTSNMGLMDRIQAKMELNRIEDRYVKRVNRNAYQSDAQYVNGEYIYACRQPVEPPPSRSSKQPKSKSSKSSSSKPTSRSSNSRDSTRTSSSRGSGKSSSSNKWSLFF